MSCPLRELPINVVPSRLAGESGAKMSTTNESNQETEAKKRRVLPPSMSATLPGPPAVSSLPRLELPPNTRWFVAETPEQCRQVAKMQLELCSRHKDSGGTVWGFDIEWFVSYEVGKQRAVSLIQFHRNTDTILYHLCCRDGGVEGDGTIVCDELLQLLTDPTIYKLGVAISGDKCKIERDLDVQVGGCVDLRSLYESCVPGEIKRQSSSGRGLSKMVADYLGRSLEKPESIRRSNWEKIPLSRSQKNYAALDSFAGFALFEHLRLTDKATRSSSSSSSSNGVDLISLLKKLALAPFAAPAVDCAAAAPRFEQQHTHSITLPCSQFSSLEGGEKVVVRITSITSGLRLELASLPWEALPTAVSDFLDSFDDVILETSLITPGRIAPAKANALAILMTGADSPQVIATKRNVQPSTIIAYVLDAILTGGAPYQFSRLQMPAHTRDSLVCACVNHHFALQYSTSLLREGLSVSTFAVEAEGSSSPKTRGELFSLLKALQKEFESAITFEDLSAVDAHLFRITGCKNWERLFVSGAANQHERMTEKTQKVP